MKTIRDIQNLENVRVLVRCDFNVPIKDGKVINDYRIRMSLPTIEYLRSKKAKIILVSHLKQTHDDADTLEPVARALTSHKVPATFVKDIASARELIEGMDVGSCILLENLRRWKIGRAHV